MEKKIIISSVLLLLTVVGTLGYKKYLKNKEAREELKKIV